MSRTACGICSGAVVGAIYGGLLTFILAVGFLPIYAWPLVLLVGSIIGAFLTALLAASLSRLLKPVILIGSSYICTVIGTFFWLFYLGLAHDLLPSRGFAATALLLCLLTMVLGAAIVGGIGAAKVLRQKGGDFP